MHDIAAEDKAMRKDVRAYLRQCVAECLPLLDKSIKLGIPPVEDADVIRKYFERKHRRGQLGTFYSLHLVDRSFGTMRPMRRDKRKVRP